MTRQNQQPNPGQGYPNMPPQPPQQYPNAQPPYPQAYQTNPPTPVQPVYLVQNPGQTLGVVGFILSILGVCSIAGIIMGTISRKKSLEAGASTGWGTRPA